MFENVLEWVTDAASLAKDMTLKATDSVSSFMTEENYNIVKDWSVETAGAVSDYTINVSEQAFSYSSQAAYQASDWTV